MINALVLESARVRSGRFGGRQIVTGGKRMKTRLWVLIFAAVLLSEVTPLRGKKIT